MELFGPDEDEDTAHVGDDVSEETRAEGTGKLTEDNEDKKAEDEPVRCALRSRKVHMSTKSSAVATWSNHAAVYKDKGFLALVAKTKPEKTLVQSKLLTRPFDRKLLEFSCSETSRLGRDRFVASG